MREICMSGSTRGTVGRENRRSLSYSTGQSHYFSLARCLPQAAITQRYMGPVETYLSEMCELHSARAGVKETTYYTALANLLDEVGKRLKPRVRCILQLQNRGAGNPDGGLFTADQFPKGSDEPVGGGIPSRGVIEVKSR